ncbi:uncharacterized protein LOC122574351 [Bombus pyrosoma]|uniref:uncharacterized protein LOC122574351 n=1 Tax=Bombus pyrosoma TaxID=396416 RepID=UPI001CB897C9|nr:uncharacterized protein LOC122574351 [Bombus pyrosoma]
MHPHHLKHSNSSKHRYFSRKCQHFKKNYLKRTTDIEEDCSVCNEQETSATENSMETHEKLFTTESELNIINERPRPGQKGKKLSLTTESENDVENQHIEIGPDGTVWKEIDGSPKPGRTSVHNIFRDVPNGI